MGSTETKRIENNIRKTYKGILTSLPSNGIFTFGSNTQGRHGKGAALTAKTKFGAVYGCAKGRQGRSYAIITKDLRIKIHPSVLEEDIIKQIHILYEYAIENDELDFYIAYSGNGTNLNGYSNKEMAIMFSSRDIPENIIFEEEFYKLIEVNYTNKNTK